MPETPNILKEIVAAKTGELARQKELVPLSQLEARIASQPPPLNLSGALLGGGLRLIAEVKKASPSKGLLRPDFDPVDLVRTYVDNGAAAVSVLTDPRFQGELSHVEQIKASGVSKRAPVMRKDFIFDPYQVYEARSVGADALLLIAAMLQPSQLKELLNLTQELWMQCLVEVHDQDELATAVEAGAEIIGINNRDLRTFNTDLAVSEDLAPKVPRGKIMVSESGISQPYHLRRLAVIGVNAVLVGEALVTAQDVAGKVREFTGQAVPTGGGGAEGSHPNGNG
jgi:indole-3-glycerol phosphate synthase